MASWRSLGGFALGAVGAASCVAVVYYLQKRRRKKGAIDTPVDEDSGGDIDPQRDTATVKACGQKLQVHRLLILLCKDMKVVFEAIEALRKECEDMKELVKQNKELQKECELSQQPHTLLKQYEESLKECEQERLAHQLLKRKYDEMIEVVKRNEGTLEHEKASLKEQIKTLQDSQEKLEKQLYESQKMWESILSECEQQRQAPKGEVGRDDEGGQTE